ncbi:Wall-associated kinase family protein [Rhynchospora pubera]|uniref:Wall-associated kinase family protein n=1 Tax=Rhynchospora pubera TaxID=906938 RepID=A0AAV8E3Q1_9POAL|nr:Wall-associated kinase family protein [Rhynchospora pubera]
MVFRSILLFFTLMAILTHRSHCLFDWWEGQPCDSIPFPFGIHGRALPGFELSCDSGEAYLLPRNNQSYLIRAIWENTLIIAIGSIYDRCYNNNGSEIIKDYSGLLNLEGTPFTFSSSENILAVVGCDGLMKIKNIAATIDEGQSGCVTFCTSSTNDYHNGLMGLGGCHAALPSHGMKRFGLEFTHLTSSTSGQRFGRLSNCSIAFITDKSELSGSYFDFPSVDVSYLFSKDKSYYPYIRPLTLQWTIGNHSCKESNCTNNSNCYDSYADPDLYNIAGYYCNCSQGFQGNPYIVGGCTDIDECRDPKMNPCVGHCINEIGNVSCACPRGMVGDGKKGGTGCRRVFPFDLTLGLGLGSIFILTAAIFWWYMSFQKRKLIEMRAKFFRQNGGNLLKERYDSKGIDSTRKIFTTEQLQKATDNYNENRVLGHGGFGTVYKGILRDKTMVAIKKSKLSDPSQVESFVNEITNLSQINHKNIVKLLGCCLETEVPLLVYEFVPNGTLFNLISGPIPLSWKDRLQIATDVAGALAYLHSAASPPIIHRDIKSSNILLDKKYTAKISDFGASRSVPFDQTHVTTVVQGTFGYLDPEYFATHQLTDKSDVYSFGVVLAELWLREKPISYERPVEIQGLAAYFSKLTSSGSLMQVMDPCIVEEAGVERIEAVGRLTDKCLCLKGEERPTMREVATELESILRAIEPDLMNPNSDALGPLLSGPKMVGKSSHSTVKEEEVTRQYSLETSMLPSMELPR